jgi:hypothetical protein
MSASASIVKELAYMDWDHRRRWRQIQLAVTDLQSGANTIPHGLKTTSQNPVAIQQENVLLTSAVQVHQTQPGDSTNLYYTVDSGTGTTITVTVVV